MLVDIKIKDPKKIKKNSILITKDGKIFEAVDVNTLTKKLNSKIVELEKRMFNLEKNTDAKMKAFIKAFMKGSVK